LTVPVKLPKEVLNLFPTWEYRCPCCGTYVESNISFCPNCKTSFDEKGWRVPPRFLRSHEAMSEYAHKVLAPKLTQKQRELLFHYFTEFLNSGWEDSGGSDVTDDGKWDGYGGALGDPVVVSDVKQSGSYAARFTRTDTDGDCYVTKSWADNPDDTFIRFYFRHSVLPASWKTNSMLQVRGDGNNVLLLSYLQDGSGYRFRLRYFYPSTTDLYYAYTISVDTWYCIEVKMRMGDASTGEYRMWLDGSNVITATGLDTSGQADTDWMKLGFVWCNYTLVQHLDCVIVVDTYIGPETAEQTYTKTWATDALFKKLGIPKALNVDAAFQKQDIPKTFGVDAAFQKSFILQKQADALFKRFGILKSFAVDARFGILMTQTVSRQIDVLLKRLDASKAFGVDVYFGPAEAQAYAKTFGLDVILAYKVRLPELWLDENGKLVLNVSRPYTWVGT
jgi:hypothetical protein